MRDRGGDDEERDVRAVVRRYVPGRLDLVRTRAVGPTGPPARVQELPSVLDASATSDPRGDGGTRAVLDPAA